MSDILGQIGAIGIVPVVVIDDDREAEALAEALLAGGLPAMEITYRTDAAQRTIEKVAKKFPSMLTGAGTVLTVDQVKSAAGSGAKFIVAPGLQRPVVEYCLAKNIPVTPGVITPTEIAAAIELGLRCLKFFPAEASGGVEYLKAVSAPFRQVKFIPTGGINESNVQQYLRLPSVHACGGSWMVRNDLIARAQFDEITRLTKRAVEIVREARKPVDQRPAGG